MMLAVLVGGFIGLAVVLGAMSGLLTVRLGQQGGGGATTANSHVVRSSVRLHNDGWFTEHIDAIDVTTSGFELIAARGVGTPIAPNSTVTVSVTVRVLDCSSVTHASDFTIGLRLHRFWGTRTESIGAGTGDLPWHSCHRA